MRSQKIKLDGSGCEAAGEKARRNKCWKGSESWRFETVDVEKWIRVGGKVGCWKVIERWRKRWMLNKKLKDMLTAEKLIKVGEKDDGWKVKKIEEIDECWRVNKIGENVEWWKANRRKLRKTLNVEKLIKLEENVEWMKKWKSWRKTLNVEKLIRTSRKRWLLKS